MQFQSIITKQDTTSLKTSQLSFPSFETVKNKIKQKRVGTY